MKRARVVSHRHRDAESTAWTGVDGHLLKTSVRAQRKRARLRVIGRQRARQRKGFPRLHAARRRINIDVAPANKNADDMRELRPRDPNFADPDARRPASPRLAEHSLELLASRLGAVA